MEAEAVKALETDDNFGGASGQADLTLIVGNYRIPVIKVLLSMSSPVFKAMFESDFDEKGKSEIKLPGKEYTSFVKFLQCLYPDTEENVSEQNVDMILSLAHEYQVNKLLRACEKVLLDSVTSQFHSSADFSSSWKVLGKRLEQAEKFDLEKLQAKCIHLVSEFPIKVIKFDDFSVSLESQVKIYRLSSMRNELIVRDWFPLISTMISKKSYLDALELTLLDKVEEGNTKDILMAARIFNVYFRSRVKLKQQILDTLNSNSRIKDDEEFDLLPDALKRGLV